MPRHVRGPFWVVVPGLLAAVLAFHLLSTVTAAATTGETSGQLQILAKDGVLKGNCPLKHTDVQATIAGFLARVTVTQTFANAATEKIEAIYTFPLPENAAVDDMTIQVGNRTIRGKIKKREEARAIYEKAKQAGHVAALLDQERPNIFTQAVANIMPGEQVVVTISYLQNLEYSDGSYQFIFPMVVGPRYIPGDTATGKQGTGWAPDTDKVPDASKVTPHIAPPGVRAGHDISIAVAIEAGVPLQQVQSSSHEIDFERTGASTATVRLKNAAEIPNKDFILKYDVAGEQIGDAVLAQAVPAGSKLGPGGYFTLILQPPARVPESDITPKELVFVLDTSGSMMGFPIEKAKELISRALDELYPGDTFNLITFSGDTQILFPQPAFPTAANIRKAKAVLNGASGNGGTEMMKAIRASLDPSDTQDHMRIVCFLTDGEVGNDMEILGEIRRHKNARVFAFGIGNSVNRFLIEGMAREGRGASEIVTLADNADSASQRLYQHLRSPLLTDVSIDWNGLPVTDVYPQRVPDLFSGKPLVISGRYTAAINGTIRVRGKRAGEDFVREVPVTLSSTANKHSVLASFWARQKIDSLMSQDWAGLQQGNVKPPVQKEITQLGLDYRLMTQFTSFVAVEERTVTKDGQPVRVEVPVELPEGMSYEGLINTEQVAGLALNGRNFSQLQSFAYLGSTGKARVVTRSGVMGGVPGGVAGGSIGGVVGGQLIAPSRIPAPPPPPPGSQAAVVNGIPLQAQGAEPAPRTEVKPTTERAMLESKLSQPLLDAYDCWKKSAADCKLVRDGNVEIEVWLTDTSAAVLEQLKALGFTSTQDHPSGKKLSGRLPAEKLADLVKLSAVQFASAVRR